MNSLKQRPLLIVLLMGILLSALAIFGARYANSTMLGMLGLSANEDAAELSDQSRYGGTIDGMLARTEIENLPQIIEPLPPLILSEEDEALENEPAPLGDLSIDTASDPLRPPDEDQPAPKPVAAPEENAGPAPQASTPPQTGLLDKATEFFIDPLAAQTNNTAAPPMAAAPREDDWRQQLLDEFNKNVLSAELDARLAEKERQRERARQADLSPLGGSLFTLDEMKENLTPNTDFAAISPNMNTSEAFDRAPVSGAPEAASKNAHRLAAGTVISATFIDSINSELAGKTRAIVTRDVFDSVNLRSVVIPKGAQLLGSYDYQTVAGQNRLFVYWTKLRLPDGVTAQLAEASSLSQSGESGLEGQRSSGFLKAIVQGTLLNLAQNAARGGSAPEVPDGLESAAKIALGQSSGTLAEEYLKRAMEGGTTFTIPAGTPFSVQLATDLVLTQGGAEYSTRQNNRSDPQSTLNYRRADYGNWSDDDGDCKNTRHELLEKSSSQSVTYSSDGCFVQTGLWNDPYSAEVFTRASALEIDHIVPVAYAHYRGAEAFSPAQKRNFYNDPANLIAVKAALNQEKSAKSPLEWLPPNRRFRSSYVTRFDAIKKKYQLSYRSGESAQIQALKDELCGA